MGGFTSRRQQERVIFGLPLEEVCRDGIIPHPLLAMILRLNKEAPNKHNIFRAPGHHGSVKKLIHFLQRGYIINMDDSAIYTVASVLKKFLQKLPGGVFGWENEEKLFAAIELEDVGDRLLRINKIITSLPATAQHLLILFFGTFRAVANSSDTGMTTEALGVSVAPSIFHSCVRGGNIASMEDVTRFKIATKVTKFLIDHFGRKIFGDENCEYYSHVTGRVVPGVHKTFQDSVKCVDLVNICATLVDDWEALSDKENQKNVAQQMSMDQLKAVNQYAERTKCLSYLPQVHQRQVARMHCRSEWFKSPCSSPLLPLVSSKEKSTISIRKESEVTCS